MATTTSSVHKFLGPPELYTSQSSKSINSTTSSDLVAHNFNNAENSYPPPPYSYGAYPPPLPLSYVYGAYFPPPPYSYGAYPPPPPPSYGDYHPPPPPPSYGDYHPPPPYSYEAYPPPPPPPYSYGVYPSPSYSYPPPSDPSPPPPPLDPPPSLGGVSSLRGYTENGSATYVSTENPLLDFFFHIVPDTPSESVTARLKSAWAYDPLKALKLICNLRGVRGTGKSDREGFYAAALWLHKHHPKTLAGNVKAIADFGYFKDLPEILYRLQEGVDVREKLKEEWLKKKNPRTKRIGLFDRKRHKYFYVKWKVTRARKKNKLPICERGHREKRIAASRRRDAAEKETARGLRTAKTMEKWKKAVDKYNGDADYRFLHDAISALFAQCLISDVELLNAGQLKKISWAAKWCPSLGSSFDKSTLLCESIARRIFVRDSYPEYAHLEEAHYACRIRDRLRKEFLAPLRRAMDLPEVYMGCNQWDSLPYNRVPSVAMKNYKYTFARRDETRFNNYLESVKRGETSIAAGALLPHLILDSLNGKKGQDVAELQWKRMVDDLSKIGKLNDCLAISDVSGSMSGTPMDVSVALGLLVSDLCQEPWKGKLITFSTDPKLHKIEGEMLKSKMESIKRMDWGGSTDFQKVFDLILQVAVDGELREDQMIKRLFVFSDMEFNEASRKESNRNNYYNMPNSIQASKDNESEWETDYRLIQKKFRAKGYKVPEIVFWNLRDSSATPVLGEQKGVALVSGFSKNMLKLFLESGSVRDLQPIAIMEKAISGAEYNNLVVLD
ncbi:hypothetical protein MKX03_032935 [Papaver bracteatum]|nr:hypothetical protein MKX03_032935 [Papaver bracteatum]